MMNELQKTIVRSIYDRNRDTNIDRILQEIKETFTVVTLCEMLSIDRNRYYYLVRNNRINNALEELIKQVQDYE